MDVMKLEDSTPEKVRGLFDATGGRDDHADASCCLSLHSRKGAVVNVTNAFAATGRTAAGAGFTTATKGC
jgi:hypothetical protein